MTPYSPVGREAQTSDLGLAELGVKLHTETGEIIGGHNSDSEQSSVDNIYAIGDILHVSRIYHTRTRNSIILVRGERVFVYNPEYGYLLLRGQGIRSAVILANLKDNIDWFELKLVRNMIKILENSVAMENFML